MLCSTFYVERFFYIIHFHCLQFEHRYKLLFFLSNFLPNRFFESNTWRLKLRRRKVLNSVLRMKKTGCLTSCIHNYHFLMTCQTFCADGGRLLVRHWLLISWLNSKGCAYENLFCHCHNCVTVIYLNTLQMLLHCPLLTLPGHCNCPHSPTLQTPAEGKEARYNYRTSATHTQLHTQTHLIM